MPYRNLSSGTRTLCIAFDGERKIAAGEAGKVARIVKRRLERKPASPILIFDDKTSDPIEINFSGSEEDVLHWIESQESQETAASSRPGRPKLGVVAREVTLLPRHWEWLEAQAGGASAALRRLVEEARKSPQETRRLAQESAYRFAVAMAGNHPGFEAATRALFANDLMGFRAHTEVWPKDIREHARALAERTGSTEEKP